MAQVILFGGGDGGGLIITPKGVRPIPPFDPSLRLQITGLSKLVTGLNTSAEKIPQEMGVLLNRISNLVMEELESVVGPLEGNNAFVYQDDDGGFTCGTTGKPPIPFPWPPKSYPSFNELITTGVLEREMIDFIDEVAKRKMNILDALEYPAKTAKQLGIKLSEKSIGDLNWLAPSQVRNIPDPIDQEVVQFFHTVAKDGKYLETWARRPHEVSAKLNVTLSDLAHERIIAGGSGIGLGPGTVMNPAIVVGVVVGVVIMLVPTVAGHSKFVINDLSGRAKF